MLRRTCIQCHVYKCFGSGRHLPWLARAEKRPFTVYGHRSRDRNVKRPPKVRWFEKLHEDGAVRPASSPEEEGAQEVQELRLKIQQLEEELSDMQKGGSAIKPLLAKLSNEDREKYHEVLRGSREVHDGAAEIDLFQNPDNENLKDIRAGDAAFDGDVDALSKSHSDLKIQLILSLDLDIYLQRLNSSLLKAAEASTLANAQSLWRWYSRAKQKLPRFLHVVPPKAWELLWSTQQKIPSDADRAARLDVLAEDMESSGTELSLGHHLMLVESLESAKLFDKAIRQYEKGITSFGKDVDLAEDYAMLGVRLHALYGRPQKANSLAQFLLEKPDQSQDRIRVLIYVIEAYLRIDGGIRDAWAAYLRFKVRLGSSVQLPDYDKIIIAFMRASRSDLALAVFKDLMLSGKAPGFDSRELYSKSLGLVGALQCSQIDAKRLNEASLEALTILPRKFQNKFFYGSWMKRLLGLGEVDAAASVIELMYERGVKPDAKHLNGIIGAWLRSGTTKEKERAEKMGLAMIQEQLKFVAQRHAIKNSHSCIDEALISEVVLPDHLQRTVSRATVETFCLLLLHYGRQQKHDNAIRLTQCLHQAELKPNAYFMNHLLIADLRQGQQQLAWKTYQTMSRTVAPDLETFAALWDCEKAHLNRLTMRQSGHFPGPRDLFREMITWFSQSSPGSRKITSQEFSKEIYDQIIRCMCLAEDLEGTLLALYALKESFQIYPDHNTARMIILQIARMAPHESKAPRDRRSRHRDASSVKSKIVKVTEILQMLTEQRRHILMARGVQSQILDEKTQAEEQLFLLAEFLRIILQRTASDETSLEENLDKIAWNMGIGGMKIVDPLLSKLS